MRDLTNEILELIRRTSSDLPKDVEERLKAAVEKEAPGSAARGALETIMKNVELSRKNSSPICQDTGTPIFNVKYPAGWSTLQLKKQIRTALADATKKSYMRPNAVDAVYDKNTGNNLGGDDFPYIHFEEEDITNTCFLHRFEIGSNCFSVDIAIHEIPVYTWSGGIRRVYKALFQDILLPVIAAGGENQNKKSREKSCEVWYFIHI